VRRDLAQACERAGIPKVTPNDLRRTFATWLAEAGVPELVTASLLGHTNSAMVRRVYACIGGEAKRSAVARLPALGALRSSPSPQAAATTADSTESTVSLIVSSQGERGEQGDTREEPQTTEKTPKKRIRRVSRLAAPRRDTAHARRRSQTQENPAICEVLGVPRPGIEPGTRGFSIPGLKYESSKDSKWLRALWEGGCAIDCVSPKRTKKR